MGEGEGGGGEACRQYGHAGTVPWRGFITPTCDWLMVVEQTCVRVAGRAQSSLSAAADDGGKATTQYLESLAKKKKTLKKTIKLFHFDH